MVFKYIDEWVDEYKTKHTTQVEISHDGIYLTVEKDNFIEKTYVPSFHMSDIRVMQTFRGDIYTSYNSRRLSSEAYDHIMEYFFPIPDIFQGAQILTLSDKIITVWGEGMEVRNTSPVQNDNYHVGIPIRYFLSKQIMNSITCRKDYVKKGCWSIHLVNTNFPTLLFTNENEYDKTYKCIVKNFLTPKESSILDPPEAII